MFKITQHPILDIPQNDVVEFLFDGQKISGQRGFSIAAALHQAGFPVHSHSIQNRERSLECGIGKCGACEMLVDGEIRRICITKVDHVKEIYEIPADFYPAGTRLQPEEPSKIFKTSVAIVGAGPAGLAVREELNKHGVHNLVIDANDKIGGQFLMQTHQFFFFEKEKKFGGMRGFDIAKTLAGESLDGILLNSTVWDLLEGKRLAVKDTVTQKVFYVDADFLVVATGAVPFMPAFENDDLPGVYTAAVVQKMMNNEFTLLGKNILTVGAGNIGYLTSYQAMQAGANVVAIIEAQTQEGGFPVQANRVRRLGIPIFTSHILLKAIPNENHTGIIGAVVAECENFQAIAGTEKIIEGIDAINICTGLMSDDPLLIKGFDVFGRNCFGVGDAIRIGEGTSAVLRGKQAALDVLQMMNKRINYDEYLAISKEYIDSQQHPTRVLESPQMPTAERMQNKGFVIFDCLYGFACNPCAFSCKCGAITKSSTTAVPRIDFDKCIGCMDCIYQCPGLAIFGFNLKRNLLFLPIEYAVSEGAEVFLVNNQGQKLGEGIIEQILEKPNKTNVARIKSLTVQGEKLTDVRGFIVKENYPKPLQFKPFSDTIDTKTFICHCDDVELSPILEMIGNRNFISVDEIKHNTRVGMGPCRGKRCIPRLKQALRSHGIDLIGDATPRGPMSNQVSMGDLYPKNVAENIQLPIKPKVIQTSVFIAGGGIAGSSLFRYFAEAGLKPVMANNERGGSWRNIAGGRPAFGLPELADIAAHNLEIFKQLQTKHNIDFEPINYVGFAHDEASYNLLDSSRSYSDAEMIAPKDFRKKISSYFNPNLKTYQAALITKNCWQASPGKVIDTLRKIGTEHQGLVLENCEVIDVQQIGKSYRVLIRRNKADYEEYHADIFINALGADADKFAQKLGYPTGLYPVKHQAFITRRLPLIGPNGRALDMLIDRRTYKNFSAVYGQQIAETGQIIGCASPLIDAKETDKSLKISNQEFLEIVSEIFCDWIPDLSSVGFQAVWSGYYVEPRYIVDPELGLFVGMRGHGFMLCQYLAKLYVDKLSGKSVPPYFDALKLSGKGLSETTFK
ncbi:MAG: FAD-dependent oxidoreductase [Bacteroidales bacterium]|nr:FAD-dependent oxidoreductase [Bacteroidales bacterium]